MRRIRTGGTRGAGRMVVGAVIYECLWAGPDYDSDGIAVEDDSWIDQLFESSDQIEEDEMAVLYEADTAQQAAEKYALREATASCQIDQNERWHVLVRPETGGEWKLYQVRHRIVSDSVLVR